MDMFEYECDKLHLRREPEIAHTEEQWRRGAWWKRAGSAWR